MLDWPQIGKFLDVCAMYFTTQLVRCAACSLALLGIVMLLRRLALQNQTFVKAMLWALFLAVPFIGRLRLFYENAYVWQAF